MPTIWVKGKISRTCCWATMWAWRSRKSKKMEQIIVQGQGIQMALFKHSSHSVQHLNKTSWSRKCLNRWQIKRVISIDLLLLWTCASLITPRQKTSKPLLCIKPFQAINLHSSQTLQLRRNQRKVQEIHQLIQIIFHFQLKSISNKWQILVVLEQICLEWCLKANLISHGSRKIRIAHRISKCLCFSRCTHSPLKTT